MIIPAEERVHRMTISFSVDLYDTDDNGQLKYIGNKKLIYFNRPMINDGIRNLSPPVKRNERINGIVTKGGLKFATKQRFTYDIDQEKIIGYLAMNNSVVYAGQRIAVSSVPFYTYFNAAITEHNIFQCAAAFSARAVLFSFMDWTTEQDYVYTPETWDLPVEFYMDCLVYMLFHTKNYAVEYQVKLPNTQTTDRVENRLLPFCPKHMLSSLDQLKIDISTLNLLSRSSYTSVIYRILITHQAALSNEAKQLYEAGLHIYRLFYHFINDIPVSSYINSDRGLVSPGWYQARMALKQASSAKTIQEVKPALANLSRCVKTLGKKILPSLYKYGFVSSQPL